MLLVANNRIHQPQEDSPRRQLLGAEAPKEVIIAITTGQLELRILSQYLADLTAQPIESNAPYYGRELVLLAAG